LSAAERQRSSVSQGTAEAQYLTSCILQQVNLRRCSYVILLDRCQSPGYRNLRIVKQVSDIYTEASDLKAVGVAALDYD